MKHLTVLVVLVTAVIMLAAFSGSADAQEHKYVGVKGCKMCHMAPARGAQFKQWEQTQHAKAYETLASEEAKAIASEKGIANPQEAAECLKCHVTGYGADPSMFTETYAKEDGVGCESCHGPGNDYKNIQIMKDVEKAKANGLIIPDKETCVKCHNEESPTFKGFNFDEMWPKVTHPVPEK
ncbi:MAG: hypothetical protein Kow0099_06370 [Candidatus Abyssubacteria bacterium]